ncbi:MAG: hypothetical protein WA188_06590 [Terriglobales bacterium]
MCALFRLPPRHIIVFAAYAILVFAGISHHEPWFDEAQSWLMARDLGIVDLLFHQIRYEGTPGLWLSLLWIANAFHLPYAALGIIGGLCASAGIFIFLRFAPFPEPIKFLLPFSFFAAYQYAVVARSYTLIPLLTFLAAHLYRWAQAKTYRFVVALALLANVSAHGTAIAIGIAAAYGWEVLGVWSSFDAITRRRHLFAAAIFGVTVAAIVAIVFPPADGNFYAFYRQPTAALAVYTTISAIAGALVGSGVISFALALLFAVWCFTRGKIAAFILPVGLMLALFFRVWAQPWHHGTLLFAMLAALWIAWPTATERYQFTRLSRASYLVVTGVLIGTLCFQLVWTSKTFIYDWSHPFSGSLDAAKYLKSVGADRKRTCALGFSTTAVLPYFQDNIFINEARPDRTAFWHWSQGNDVTQQPELLLALMPEFTIVGWKQDEEVAAYDRFMREAGYSLVHESIGEMYFKDVVQQPDTYRIYKRNAVVAAESVVVPQR